ncbi:hypothetical protein LWX53_08500 [bacterium]|nr:hypothetical protein [bacterium]
MGKTRMTTLISLIVVAASMVSCASAPPKPAEPSAEANRAKTIVQGSSTPDFPATPSIPNQSPSEAAKAIVTQQPGPQAPGGTSPIASAAVLSSEDQAFLANYLSRLSYMVYYNDASGMDPRFAKMAVSQANRYLIEKLGLAAIDFDQIEKNKKDQLGAYQAETGGSIDMIQYLAQKFNADIYVEIDLKASASGAGNSFNGSAQGTMKLFETSTAQLLGSIAFMSPPTFSPVSPDAAVANAISASVWQAMPKVTEQARALIAASASRGVRYELIVQKLPDAKQSAAFVKALSRKFAEAEQISFSAGETRIALYAFMTKAKVQQAIYDAGALAALPDLYLVYMRGKSFTFNSGL